MRPAQEVAIITGAAQRSICLADAADFLTVQGDIAEAETADARRLLDR